MSARKRGDHMSERVRVVATVMIGTISTVLAATIVNVAFPAIMRELDVGHDTLQWVSTAFLAATATTMLGTAWSIETWGGGGRSLPRSRSSLPDRRSARWHGTQLR